MPVSKAADSCAVTWAAAPAEEEPEVEENDNGLDDDEFTFE